jgi:chitodextrinase
MNGKTSRIAAVCAVLAALAASCSQGSSGDSGSGQNVAPVAVAKAAGTVLAGVSYALDGSASADTDGTIVSWRWDLGNGSAALSGKTATALYREAGTYTITLTVTDNDGATAKDTLDVIVGASGTVIVEVE